MYFLRNVQFSLVQSLSRVQLSVNPWTAALQAPLSITNFWSLLKHDHRVSDAIQSSHPLSSLSPPSFNLSQNQGLNESDLPVRWPKYWNFSISPSNEHPGLISFRMDWLDLLSVQGTLKSLLQHHSSKASVLQCSAFFMVQLSHPYMTIGKTIALTRQTFISKVMSLLFNNAAEVGHSFSSKEQASFNIMVAVTICCDFGTQENSLSLFPLFPHLFVMKCWDWMPWS